ncbi:MULTISPECIES: hypothetical protein [Agrobacterium]|uniref:Apea-like HEPN domain-containing protein n=1 Tax=Agrobacterium rubi TaxID=28099 RepID=A0AAE7R7K5_9HYPH|nr:MULTISPECIES: hypothetical protein [Agrobacterium]MBN7807758.1 hypothetical protein [Agrobacterium rosae]NTE89719.1 hypothetical protein [Agrobacterium rubi]NTF05431.1 hypothetical protein [Agrobacterium rubi]NTF39874.1 hypothetical protein [Agrobacterium rubi]OCJ44826.1 hypothetical protein A6U92_16420 [Agrobacterium rubi]
MAATPSMIAAVEALWRIPRPGPDNLLAAPAFAALSELCQSEYGGGKAVFALSTALRSLGLPCHLPANNAGLSLDPVSAANAIDETYKRKTTLRRHLCPLDLADELPVMNFGRARVARFSADELTDLFDAPRLARNFLNQPFEARRLAQFHWLVVEEEIELDLRARTSMFGHLTFDRDFGEIDPHLGRFPPVVEAALFFLLLAPWEQWSTMQEIDWRGFRIPWIHTVDEDLFVRPSPPPSADNLTLEPWIVQDHCGKDVELERPTALGLDDEAQSELAKFTDDAWRELETALASALFETPVAHFLVRGFLADGMDEVMAHMTAIEAAVGLGMDHKKGLRPKPDPHKKVSSATERVAARVAAVLKDGASVQAYRDLFELRSTFVHGRAGLQKVSTAQRVMARSLARGVARGLVSVALQGARSRTDALSELLDHGVQHL